MTDRHTPGPLLVDNVVSDEREDGYDVILGYDIPGEGSPIVVASFVHDEGHGGHKGPITRSQALANARLYAASPKLLAACRAARDQLNGLMQAMGELTLASDVEAANLLDVAIAEAEKGPA